MTIQLDAKESWHFPDTYEDVQRTKQLFLIVQAAVMPTKVLPAPQGSTIMPDRARLVIRNISHLQTSISQSNALPISEHF